jgi:hypothetical protein
MGGLIWGRRESKNVQEVKHVEVQVCVSPPPPLQLPSISPGISPASSTLALLPQVFGARNTEDPDLWEEEEDGEDRWEDEASFSRTG